jgi:hypothetical protein
MVNRWPDFFLWRTKRLRAAGGVAGVLRLASQAALFGLPLLLR